MSESKLILHCGSREATRAELALVPMPEATKIWSPAPHIRVIDDRHAELLILRMFERRIISHRTLPGVIHEWRSPSFGEFQDRTAWSLFNAATTTIGDRQRSNPQSHSHLTMRLGARLDEHLGIAPFLPTTNGNSEGPGHA